MATTSAAPRGRKDERIVLGHVINDRLATDATLDRVLRLGSRATGGTVSLLLGDDDASWVFRQDDGSNPGSNQGDENQGDRPATWHLCRLIAGSGGSITTTDLLAQPVPAIPACRSGGAVRAVIGVPVRDGDDRVRGALCISHPRPLTWTEDDSSVLADIRGLVEAQLESIASEVRNRGAMDANEAAFRLMADASGGGIVSGTVDGRITFANDAFLQMIQRRRDEIEDGTLRWTDLTPPDGLAADQNAIARAQQGLPNEPYEKEYVLPGGGRVPVMVSPSMLRGGELVATVIDMTEQITARRTRRDTEERLWLGMRAGRMRTWDLDVETGTVTWLNPGGQVAGPEPGDWTSFLAAVHPEDLGTAQHVIEDAVASGAAFHLEFRWAEDGTEGRWSYCTGNVVLDEDGRTRRIVGIDIDISARKRLERERRDFIDVLVHDLKNPIAGMQMQIQLLRRRGARGVVPDQDDLEERLGAVDQSIRRVSRRIDELAEFSRLGIGLPVSLRLASSDLVAIVLRALEEAQAGTHQHVITLVTPVPPAMGYWDGERLERVFANLFANAVKYSPGGGDIGVRITLAGSDVEVEVTDEGIGVPAADVPTLFNAGRRGTNVGSIRGSGIGLAGSAALIRLHGGTIGVESEVGRGSTFTVQLPIRTDLPEATLTDGESGASPVST
ncbi:MAG: ATP-binding protein [Thermomicrobiales bacterium]